MAGTLSILKEISAPSTGNTQWRLTLTITVAGNATQPAALFIHECATPGVVSDVDTFLAVATVHDVQSIMLVPLHPAATYRKATVSLTFVSRQELNDTFDLIYADIIELVSEFTGGIVDETETVTISL